MCGEERSVGKGGVWGGEEGEVRGGVGGEGRVWRGEEVWLGKSGGGEKCVVW